MLEKSLVFLGHVIFDQLYSYIYSEYIISETEFFPVTVYNYSIVSGVKFKKKSDLRNIAIEEE